MNLLEAVVQTPMAGALGWAVLHSLWEGAVISAALAALLLAIASPRLRYAMACMALLTMLGGFTTTLYRMMPEHVNALQPLPSSVSQVSNPPTIPKAPHRLVPNLEAIAPWLAPFWITGVLAFYLRDVGGFLSVHRLRRRGVCCAAARWQQEVVRLSTRLRLTRTVTLLESSLAEAPAVLGHFRPVILIPAGLLAGLPAGQIEAILLHELAHIRRHDYLVNVLQHFVEGLLFFNPAAWWITRVIRAERENCCDDVVVSITGDAHEYAVALATLEHNRWSGRESVIAATGGNLMTRIRRLLYPKGSNGTWTPLLAALALLAAAALALPQTPASPYVLWLNEDVTYIITEPERAAFQVLGSDEERTKFIERFWLRRDPTPGTLPNEFKEEHYRRIAYANQRFAMNGKAGWKTDRGRIYIQWGPPDELESHPAGNANTPPHEVWLYRHVENIGDNLFITFRDRSRTGDYQIAPGNVQ